MKLYKVVKKNIPVEAYQTEKPLDIHTLEGVMQNEPEQRKPFRASAANGKTAIKI